MKVVSLFVFMSALACVSAALHEVRPLPANVSVDDFPTLEEKQEMARQRKARLAARNAAYTAAGLDGITNAYEMAEVASNALLQASTLSAIVADTRENIPEVSGLSDMEVMGLYVKQMQKDARPLLEALPTGTVERVIGAGMRQDLNRKE